jgi:gas vesicle protein
MPKNRYGNNMKITRVHKITKEEFTMRRFFRLNILAVTTVFLLGASLGFFTDSYAERARFSPSKSKIKARGKAVKEQAITRWNALSPEQQEHFEEIAKERATKAKMTSEEYWNSRSQEEQDELKNMAKDRAEKARKRWQDLPE